MSADGKSDVMYGSHSGGGHSSCPAGVPVEFALLSILAAFGVAFGVLYQALTIITGRRRKRNAVDSEGDAGREPEPEVGFVFRFADFLWLGEFYWQLHTGIYWVLLAAVAQHILGRHLLLHSHLNHLASLADMQFCDVMIISASRYQRETWHSNVLGCAHPAETQPN